MGRLAMVLLCLLLTDAAYAEGCRADSDTCDSTGKGGPTGGFEPAAYCAAEAPRYRECWKLAMSADAAGGVSPITCALSPACWALQGAYTDRDCQWGCNVYRYGVDCEDAASSFAKWMSRDPGC